MKTREKISARRKQSRIELPKKNIWYYTEDFNANQAIPKRKPVRDDQLNISQNEYDRYSLDTSDKFRTKRENTFVVDWQMTDVF
ncbi:MAG: hypothetical protein ACYC25_17160 [Paludibacter sp.]